MQARVPHSRKPLQFTEAASASSLSAYTACRSSADCSSSNMECSSRGVCICVAPLVESNGGQVSIFVDSKPIDIGTIDHVTLRPLCHCSANKPAPQTAPTCAVGGASAMTALSIASVGAGGPCAPMVAAAMLARVLQAQTCVGSHKTARLASAPVKPRRAPPPARPSRRPHADQAARVGASCQAQWFYWITTDKCFFSK